MMPSLKRVGELNHEIFVMQTVNLELADIYTRNNV